MFPCATNGNRRSSISKIPALVWRVLPDNEFTYVKTQKAKMDDARYQGRTAKSEQT